MGTGENRYRFTNNNISEIRGKFLFISETVQNSIIVLGISIERLFNSQRQKGEQYVCTINLTWALRTWWNVVVGTRVIYKRNPLFPPQLSSEVGCRHATLLSFGFQCWSFRKYLLLVLLGIKSISLLLVK